MYQPTPAGEAFQINGVWHQDYNVQNPVTGQMEVKRYMHNGVDWVEAPMQNSNATTKIDFTKKIPDTAAGISLKKNIVNLDKCLVNLSKYKGIDMGMHRAKVAIVLDFSGSMRSLYRNGAVQRTVTRLVPLGLRFDDNGELDAWIFHDSYRRLDGIDLSNFENYVDEVIMGSGEKFGCTSYSPVLKDVFNKYIEEEPSKFPSFVIFVTDGSNDDRRKTDDIIRLTSKYNMFIQFVGLGTDDDFSYLKKLDNLTGRPVDNTGFIEVADFDRMNDDELYSKLLEQYVDWIKEMRIS